MEWLTWIGILFCVSQSAMFSGLNLAFFSVNKLNLNIQANHGNQKAAQVLAIRENSNFLLACILWGNVGINVLLTLLSNSVLAGLTAFFFSTFVITIFGEILPQAYFSRNALKMASLLLPLFKIYQRLLYPLAKPTEIMLNRWLGKEHIEYYEEHHIAELIRLHIKTSESDIGKIEGIGALNFLAIDDLHLWEEGQEIDPQSIIQLKFQGGTPIFPEITLEFLRTISQSGKNWIILTDEHNNPRLVLDSDSFIRDRFLEPEHFDPHQYCHEPIIIKDPNMRLAQVFSKFRVDVEHLNDNVIDLDIVLFWGEQQKRIITGTDILGRLMHGIAQRQISKIYKNKQKTHHP